MLHQQPGHPCGGGAANDAVIVVPAGSLAGLDISLLLRAHGFGNYVRQLPGNVVSLAADGRVYVHPVHAFVRAAARGVGMDGDKQIAALRRKSPFKQRAVCGLFLAGNPHFKAVSLQLCLQLFVQLPGHVAFVIFRHCGAAVVLSVMPRVQADPGVLFHDITSVSF